ncbi:ROK family protein [Tessaracoccus sp. ZS01]|uniref:ROK family protein n=1 Tax=Tessaracoccus sp. ZS01 TaxID=1906324 RepID=UPI00096FE287|nr:ROK family protein [Tessaracoccus sp. ZS01]MCG6568625.1 ROK family protein [Tessaracoccus sp. ZS01]OMG52224.1 hypothetical protein BJN44_13475 [Tessaracoccus sp. ZS01]
MKDYIGVDIGGTKIAVVRCNADGEVLSSTTVPAPAQAGGDAMIAAVKHGIESLGDEPIAAIGVGAAGVISGGTVVAASDTFVDWVGVAIDRRLRDRFRVPVYALNDVNAFLAGELTWGVGRGESDLFGLTLGTGVGGAVALNGRVWVGRGGMAGEIGHTPGYGDLLCTCGQSGHLETRASGRAIEAAFLALTGRATPGTEIADRARVGDPSALAVYDGAAQAVAQAAVTAANLFDLLHVVVGGGVRQAWDVLSRPLEQWLARLPSVSGVTVRVSPSSLGKHGVALGAAAAAMEEESREPVGL